MGEKSVITVFIYRPQQENYVLYIGSTVQLVLSLISTIPLSKLDTSEIWIVNMESSTIKRKKNLIIVQKKKINFPDYELKEPENKVVRLLFISGNILFIQIIQLKMELPIHYPNGSYEF